MLKNSELKGKNGRVHIACHVMRISLLQRKQVQ